MACVRTGRAVTCKKMRVEDVRSLDILPLQKTKIFQKGSEESWIATWRHLNKVTSTIECSLVYFNNKPYSVRFQYTLSDPDGSMGEDLDYQIRITSTKCNFGGVRWWFICPLVVNGEECERRCRILYLPNGAKYFGCRECHNLSYESRQQHRLKFYEEFAKPMKKLYDFQDQLKRATSTRALNLDEKYEEAQKKVLNYLYLTYDRGKS